MMRLLVQIKLSEKFGGKKNNRRQTDTLKGENVFFICANRQFSRQNSFGGNEVFPLKFPSGLADMDQKR